MTHSTADVAITDPNGQPVSASSIVEVGLNRFRISFAPLTVNGQYHVLVGPDVHDLAGNPLNQDGDGTFGESGDGVSRADPSDARRQAARGLRSPR